MLSIHELREKAKSAAKRTAEQVGSSTTAFFPMGERFGVVCHSMHDGITYQWDSHSFETRKEALKFVELMGIS